MGAGINAAPAMTRPKAMDTSDDGECADPDRVAEHENATDDRGEVGGNPGERDHGHALGPSCSARAEDNNASTESRQRHQSPLADKAHAILPCSASVRYFKAMSDTPNSTPAATPSSSPSAAGPRPLRIEIRGSSAATKGENTPHSTAINAASE